MATIEELLQELDQEAQATKRTLARIPEARLGWRPHERSMTLGQLASHVASLPAVVLEMSALPRFDVRTPSEALRRSGGDAATVPALLALLDRSVARARAALAGMNDAALAAPWHMVQDEQVVGSIPRGAFLRNALFSHWSHHRGQLTVYLRLAGAPVPAIYGDSADEPAGA